MLVVLAPKKVFWQVHHWILEAGMGQGGCLGMTKVSVLNGLN